MEQSVTTWIDIQQVESNIVIDLHEDIDQNQSEIKINGQKWNNGLIDIHEAKSFEIEFLLKDEQGQIVEKGRQTIEGDTTAPLLRFKEDKILYLSEEYELKYQYEKEDLDEILVYVNEKEVEASGSLLLKSSDQSVKWVLKDKAGNETIETIRIEKLIKPVGQRSGKTITYSLLPGFSLQHNQKRVIGNQIELEKGENTIELISPYAQEPLEIETLTYSPEPLMASIFWKDDQLYLLPNRECQELKVEINGEVYRNQTMIDQKASATKQELEIKITMVDAEQNRWEQNEKMIILPLIVQEEPESKPENKEEEKIEPAILPSEPVKSTSEEKRELVLAEEWPTSKKEPIQTQGSSTLFDTAIVFDPDEKLTIHLEPKPVSLAPKLTILNDQLQEIQKENQTDLVRIRIDVDEEAKIDTIRFNGETIEKDQIQYDRLQRAYIEVSELQEENQVQIEYQQNGESKKLAKTFQIKKPSSVFSQIRTWFQSLVHFFLTCLK